MPICVALVELAIESENFDRVQSLLNQGFALDSANLPEQKERDRFSERIQILQTRLEKLSE